MDSKEQIVTSLQTAQAELENALTNLAKLPAFDASRVQFAAHTLSNYLTVISAGVDLLQLYLKDHPDEQIHRWLESLRHVTALMVHIVLDLMNAPVAEREQFLWEKIDLPMLVQRACNHYRQAADRKQISISVEAEVASPFVWADRVAVAAVLDNLLSNAVKYSPPQKRVWVRVTEEPGHLVCTVQDEGPGLSGEDQGRLFQRGVRLSTVPTGGEPSTGYGLAVAKDLIDKLNGEIWCESQLGQGASFSLRLPLYSEEQHGRAEA
ncbi:MAG TPA: HAMP domain-containing sensor histidine kinase [Candidatus Tectomicrobia bacterium]|nr:HAMP domain-containing sensor histidine kinase [Candidatus Tectomicrobia bacterium]